MNKNGKLLRRMALMLLLGAAMAGCASGPNAPSPELLQRIAAASTRSDHETLAAYYDREAAAARVTAETHRKIAKNYSAMTTGGRGSANLQAPHNSIITQNESIATEYSGLAEEHRRMAAHAQP